MLADSEVVPGTLRFQVPSCHSPPTAGLDIPRMAPSVTRKHPGRMSPSHRPRSQPSRVPLLRTTVAENMYFHQWDVEFHVYFLLLLSKRQCKDSQMESVWDALNACYGGGGGRGEIRNPVFPSGPGVCVVGQPAETAWPAA